MEWPKLKNIILIILAVTDLFLLSLVGLRDWNSSRYQAEVRQDALKLLEKNGIQMEEGLLPRDACLPVATVTREQEKEIEALSQSLGEGSEVAQGGGQYHYTGTKGEAYLRNRGGFFISLASGAYPAEGEIGQHAADTLSLMGFEGLVVSVEGDETEGEVELMQLWEGIPVRGCSATVSYEQGELVAISGVWLNGTPVLAGELELSAVTGLLRFLEEFADTGDVCNQILTMQVEYQYSTSLTKASVLLPVWFFETDTGCYHLDITAGQLEKL